MADPILGAISQPISPVGPAPAAGGISAAPADGENFAGVLRSQLERVSQMRAEADEGVQRLLTGQSQNITEVFVAARKAQVAFSLLMEIRNKLTDAYDELRQMRV